MNPILLLACLALPGYAEDKIEPEKMTKTDSGLRYQDVKKGEGAQPKAGQRCKVHYTGWLWEEGKKGMKFDSSVDRGQPFSFPVGEGQVIKGWDEGVLSMKVGTKRLLLIPPALAYGDRNIGPIPAGSTLLFEVELLGID